jgi:hypothetical protein
MAENQTDHTWFLQRHNFESTATGSLEQRNEMDSIWMGISWVPAAQGKQHEVVEF